MSSARDEHDTVPPPAGEEDAYSAATKVGAMPAELMARLRAEGLLPEEDVAEQRPAPSRPTSALTPRPPPPAPHASSPPEQRTAFDEVPDLTSDPPPEVTVPSIPAAHTGASTPQQPAPSGVMMAPPAPLETPIAFASPPSASSVAPPAAEEAAPLSGRSAEEVRAFGARSKLRTTTVLVAVLFALVAFAFVMALLSQRR